MNYIEGYSGEAHGTQSVGIKINVAIGRALTDNDKHALSEAYERLQEALLQESMALDPKCKTEADTIRRDLMNCFPAGPIYVKPVPNGYCNRWCCKHLLWYEVTTLIGVITIGWRKRVINIDWSKSDIKTLADDLFKSEDVTKGDRYIHAWSYEKAREYLAAIIAQTL